jgi:hypothetical protein
MKKWIMMAALAGALSGCIGAGEISSVGTVAKPGAIFPDVVGINLDGDRISLPAGFKGRRNLIAIGFEREHQADIDTWIDVADQLAVKHQGFRFYEVPTIYEVNAAYRFWINNGMRLGIPAAEARTRTVTVYVDRAAFNKSLAISDTKEIHVLLVDADSRILWRTAGPASAAKLAALDQALSG